MASFEVIGYGRDTGRRRKRVYDARDEDGAIQKASDDGTVVESVCRLPEEPATDRQIAFARDLHLSFPPRVTKDEMSDLLDTHLGKDKPATDRHRSFADFFGVSYSQYTGKRRLFERILYEVKQPGREMDLAAWFTYRVCRDLCHGEDPPSVNGPSSEAIRSIAEIVVAEEDVLKSIRKYEGKDLIWFGQWTAPDGHTYEGGSRRTRAFQRVSGLLCAKLGLTERKDRESRQRQQPLAKRTSRSTTNSVGSERTPPPHPQNARRGCTGMIAVVVGLFVLIAMVVWGMTT